MLSQEDKVDVEFLLGRIFWNAEDYYKRSTRGESTPVFELTMNYVFLHKTCISTMHGKSSFIEHGSIGYNALRLGEMCHI